MDLYMKHLRLILTEEQRQDEKFAEGLREAKKQLRLQTILVEAAISGHTSLCASRVQQTLALTPEQQAERCTQLLQRCFCADEGTRNAVEDLLELWVLCDPAEHRRELQQLLQQWVCSPAAHAAELQALFRLWSDSPSSYRQELLQLLHTWGADPVRHYNQLSELLRIWSYSPQNYRAELQGLLNVWSQQPVYNQNQLLKLLHAHSYSPGTHRELLEKLLRLWQIDPVQHGRELQELLRIWSCSPSSYRQELLQLLHTWGADPVRHSNQLNELLRIWERSPRLHREELQHMCDIWKQQPQRHQRELAKLMDIYATHSLHKEEQLLLQLCLPAESCTQAQLAVFRDVPSQQSRPSVCQLQSSLQQQPDHKQEQAAESPRVQQMADRVRMLLAEPRGVSWQQLRPAMQPSQPHPAVVCDAPRVPRPESYAEAQLAVFRDMLSQQSRHDIEKLPRGPCEKRAIHVAPPDQLQQQAPFVETAWLPREARPQKQQPTALHPLEQQPRSEAPGPLHSQQQPSASRDALPPYPGGVCVVQSRREHPKQPLPSKNPQQSLTTEPRPLDVQTQVQAMCAAKQPPTESTRATQQPPRRDPHVPSDGRFLPRSSRHLEDSSYRTSTTEVHRGIAQLREMGFTTQQAEVGYALSNGNIENAIEWCIANPSASEHDTPTHIDQPAQSSICCVCSAEHLARAQFVICTALRTDHAICNDCLDNYVQHELAVLTESSDLLSHHRRRHGHIRCARHGEGCDQEYLDTDLSTALTPATLNMYRLSQNDTIRQAVFEQAQSNEATPEQVAIQFQRLMPDARMCGNHRCRLERTSWSTTGVRRHNQ
eukprot:TRINITY_DN1831_c0_g1_i3.p1 TRINITY_DN1831_c0_g1~~TRINITY_DN1831_c0_g1_i3.p1  ORF type:complete len:827 (+),score=134.78 TRINITY_DN1831_c0_g1_i3:1825-4305(+)